MSRETLDWLNNNTLVGFTTDKEKWAAGWGTFKNDHFAAWWQREGYTGGFEGPVPIEEVQRRLFFWEPIEAPLFTRMEVDITEAQDIDPDTGLGFLDVEVVGKKAIIRPDTQDVLGIFGENTYKVHGYTEWLIDQVGTILDQSRGELGISSAGLLRRGGVAYVTIELPETVETSSGDGIRPAIIAATSLDGSKATTYAMRAMRPVCDNSLDVGLMGSAGKVKIKHSSLSLGRIGEVRDALGVMYKATDDMVRFFDELTQVDVTNKQFTAIVQGLVPVPDPVVGDKRQVVNQRAITIAQNKQDDLLGLWHKDPRVGDLGGTLAGAYQAVNTWHEHFVTRTTNQVERVMQGTLDGTFSKADQEFWDVVQGLEIPVPVLAIGEAA